jgi:hypothetical protein
MLILATCNVLDVESGDYIDEVRGECCWAVRHCREGILSVATLEEPVLITCMLKSSGLGSRQETLEVRSTHARRKLVIRHLYHHPSIWPTNSINSL